MINPIGIITNMSPITNQLQSLLSLIGFDPVSIAASDHYLMSDTLSDIKRILGPVIATQIATRWTDDLAKNNYHNAVHEAWVTNQILNDCTSDSNRYYKELIVAAAMHDANHIGSKDDSNNVHSAIECIRNLSISDVDVNIVCTIVQSSKFPHEQLTFTDPDLIAACATLRGVDLLQTCIAKHNMRPWSWGGYYPDQIFLGCDPIRYGLVWLVRLFLEMRSDDLSTATLNDFEVFAYKCGDFHKCVQRPEQFVLDPHDIELIDKSCRDVSYLLCVLKNTQRGM